MSRRKASLTTLARRASQVAFLLLFVGLVVLARSQGDSVPSPLIKLFFWVDPLVLLATWLSAHALPVALVGVPAVVVLAVLATVLRRRVSTQAVLLTALGILVAAVIVTAAVGQAFPPDAAGAISPNALMPVANPCQWIPLPKVLLWSLATIVVTMLLGRVFCGWFCPLGTVHAIASRLLVRRTAKRHDPWSPWQRGKYYVLVGLLVMALLGSHWVTIFDPLVLLYRTTTTALLPAVQWSVEESWQTVLKTEPQETLQPKWAREEGEEARPAPWQPSKTIGPVYETARDRVFNVFRQAFLGSGLIVTFFLVTLGLNAWRPRFWCRYVCPLGGLLGLLAWRPLLRRGVRKEDCNGCDLCGMKCHGAAASGPGEQWKAAECFGCFNCRGSCPRDALGFRWDWPWRLAPAEASIDLSKRATLAGALGGVAALALLRATPQARGQTFHPKLIRPPGSREEREFLQRCTACGLCMKVCPTGGLQPCWTEAGLEGLWTPRLVPLIGACTDTCTLCGQVCPTEAIRPLVLDVKKKTKIGLASFDTTRCIPYAYGRECSVCEECCPVADKAIYMVETKIKTRNGKEMTIGQPHVDPNRCTGCGMCENKCPLRDSPGVRVFSANESRNPANQPLPVWDEPVAPAGDDPY